MATKYPTHVDTTRSNDSRGFAALLLATYLGLVAVTILAASVAVVALGSVAPGLAGSLAVWGAGLAVIAASPAFARGVVLRLADGFEGTDVPLVDSATADVMASK